MEDKMHMSMGEMRKNIRYTLLSYKRPFTFDEAIARIRVKYAIDNKKMIYDVIKELIDSGALSVDYTKGDSMYLYSNI